MIDPFIEKNWKTLAVVLLVFLAVFVWPTLYKELPLLDGKLPQRQNRITGKCQLWDGGAWSSSY